MDISKIFLKMKKLKTMDDIALDGRSVLLRVDFNVPVGDDGVVDQSEDYRIEVALKTLEELRRRRCKIVLLTHRGRPNEEGGDYSLEPIRKRLEELIKDEVRQIPKMDKNMVESMLTGFEVGSVLILPNVRLDEREVVGSEGLAEELADLADVYVNEAFSVCHRDHASIARIPRLMESCAGRHTVLEYEALSKLANNPRKPYVAVVSGAKVHTKITLLWKLLEKADYLCVGGRIANAFLIARGLCPDFNCDSVDIEGARKIWENFSDKIVLPVDVVITDSASGEVKTVLAEDIPETAAGVWDIGPNTVDSFLRTCSKAETVVWNGPLGKFEEEQYKEGTEKFAKGLAELGAFRVVGGGDTVSVLEHFNLMSKFDHVSVGGGAMITMLEEKEMPGLVPLLKE